MSSFFVEISPAVVYRRGTVEKSKHIKASRNLRPDIKKWTINAVTENFDRLADLIASYPVIARNTHFVFVPGPLDITANSILPRRPLLSSFVGKIKTSLSKPHFLSNPCRIKCFGQEIVVHRDDMMARMLRNLVGVKPDIRNDDMKRFVGLFFHFRTLTNVNQCSIARPIRYRSSAPQPFYQECSANLVRVRPHPPTISYAKRSA